VSIRIKPRQAFRDHALLRARLRVDVAAFAMISPALRPKTARSTGAG
jgi:hypothetical protein